MKNIALSLALALLSSSAFAHEGHEHPETASGTAAAANHDPHNHAQADSSAPRPDVDDGSDDAAAEDSEYAEFAAHLSFANDGVHAHAYWKALPAVDQEAFLQLEFRDAKTHDIVMPDATPSVAIWNTAYGYGLVQPSTETALDKDGKAIFGTFNVSNIFFLATGHWEVRVYLSRADGTESEQTFVVDLGEVAPSPACDPNSPVAAMMHNAMNMGGMMMPDCSGNADSTSVHDPAMTHDHSQ